MEHRRRIRTKPIRIGFRQPESVFFSFQTKKNVRLEDFVFVRCENIFGKFWDFLEKSQKIKGKIVLVTENIEKFRLRRVKNGFLERILKPNQSHLVKIAPEWR